MTFFHFCRRQLKRTNRASSSSSEQSTEGSNTTTTTTTTTTNNVDQRIDDQNLGNRRHIMLEAIERRNNPSSN